MKLGSRDSRFSSRRRRPQITTPRLTIRMLERDDITEFVRYRNLPAVAQYQDWPLPFTRDLAHQLIDELEPLTGPTPGAWIQLAVTLHSELIGDVAVWLDEPGEFALLGYTIAPEFQGQGFAVEAAGAVVDHLFSRAGVHRVGVTLDPRNLASARVAEQCGFEYVGTARSAALARGEWTDDARFSILADDRRSWKQRPRKPQRDVRLVAINADLVPAVAAAAVSFSQRGLVASNAVAMSEAAHSPRCEDGTDRATWEWAVVADDAVVGHVIATSNGSDQVELRHLMVAFEHQRRGIGRRVVELVADRARDQGAAALSTWWTPDVVGSPERFFVAVGFVPGPIDAGRRSGRLDL